MWSYILSPFETIINENIECQKNIMDSSKLLYEMLTDFFDNYDYLNSVVNYLELNLNQAIPPKLWIAPDPITLHPKMTLESGYSKAAYGTISRWAFGTDGKECSIYPFFGSLGSRFEATKLCIHDIYQNVGCSTGRTNHQRLIILCLELLAQCHDKSHDGFNILIKELSQSK